MFIWTLGKEPAVSPWKTNHFLTFDELLFMGLKQANESTLLFPSPSHSIPLEEKSKPASRRPSQPDPNKRSGCGSVSTGWQNPWRDGPRPDLWGKSASQCLFLSPHVVRHSSGCGAPGFPTSKMPIPAMQCILRTSQISNTLNFF